MIALTNRSFSWDVHRWSTFTLAFGCWLFDQKLRKEITACKAKQIHKMTTIFTQNGPRLSFYEFTQLRKQIFLSQLEINYVTQEPTAQN